MTKEQVIKINFALDAINKKENLYGDNIAKVEQYDFSRANMSDEARTHAISAIATICTQKFDSIGSEKLCTKLLTEAHGIPSSAYGFVPILLTKKQSTDIVCSKGIGAINSFANIVKFGEAIENEKYILTNLRALVNDIGLEASKEFYNTDENEIAIIKKHFKVFKHKMDIRSARQFMRHTTAVWQELSRRYVSGKKVPFEFYISDKMQKVTSKTNFTISSNKENIDLEVNTTTSNLLRMCLEHYKKALEDGVKPQDARDILPLCTYTEIWSGWQPSALKNMLTERTAIGTQWELRQVALAIKELINESK